MQERLLVIWGGGVVVGSPQGARQYQPCMPMWLTKFVTWYLVPYGTIVDPAQVSLCLITVYDPTPPGLDLYLWFPFDWYAMICLLCHVIFIYILLVIFLYLCHVYNNICNCLLAAWLLVYSWYLVIILRVHSKYSPFLGLAFYARFSARIIFYHSEELEWEVLGSVAQPEPVEWSRSEPLPLLYLPLPLNTLYIAMFGMMHYLASMAI